MTNNLEEVVICYDNVTVLEFNTRYCEANRIRSQTFGN
jgi:hypothetical protein